MTESAYLIAIGLIDQNGMRAMPIGGKSIKGFIQKDKLAEEEAKTVALEIALRVLKLSESGMVKIAASKKSILIAQISMESMNNNLPLIKNNWIKSGNTEEFIIELKKICYGLWNLDFVKYEGLTFKAV